MTPMMSASQALELGARDEARYVLAHCRARDRAEIEATCEYQVAATSIVDMLPVAVVSKILLHKGAPAALVMFHQLTPSALTVSMIATDDWPHVAMAAVKWGLRQAKPLLLALGYRRAECRAIDGHTDAIAFLRFLGFQIEARVPEFGRNGEAFVQLAWRLSDHMHSAESQLAKTAAS